MMMSGSLRMAFIVTGRPGGNSKGAGLGMAREHAAGFRLAGGCDFVACCSRQVETAREFAEAHGIARIYTDYRQMLADGGIDLVSICAWTSDHAEMVIAAARSGVKAIHCVKPMAQTWGDARRMAEVCAASGVTLTFQHHKRFLEPYTRVKEIVHDGTIGQLLRMESNLYNPFDWGTHWLDIWLFWNDEGDAEWVMGQTHCEAPHRFGGTLMESQGLSQVQFASGVRGLFESGRRVTEVTRHRLIGTDGLIEVRGQQPHVRVLSHRRAGWQEIQTQESLMSESGHVNAAADVIHSLREGRPSTLSAANALRATELIFATYESSRRRARVDLPLTTDDNAYVALFEAGEIGPGWRGRDLK